MAQGNSKFKSNYIWSSGFMWTKYEINWNWSIRAAAESGRNVAPKEFWEFEMIDSFAIRLISAIIRQNRLLIAALTFLARRLCREHTGSPRCQWFWISVDQFRWNCLVRLRPGRARATPIVCECDKMNSKSRSETEKTYSGLKSIRY